MAEGEIAVAQHGGSVPNALLAEGAEALFDHVLRLGVHAAIQRPVRGHGPACRDDQALLVLVVEAVLQRLYGGEAHPALALEVVDVGLGRPAQGVVDALVEV